MVRTHTLRRAAAALAFCAIACLSAPASAQYFGNNKVQYRTFDFQILKTEHFDIYFYPSEKSGVDIAARLAISEKTVRNHTSNLFDKLGVWSRAQAIVFARDHGFRG